MMGIAVVALFGASIMILLAMGALWCEHHPERCGPNDDGGQRP